MPYHLIVGERADSKIAVLHGYPHDLGIEDLSAIRCAHHMNK